MSVMDAFWYHADAADAQLKRMPPVIEVVEKETETERDTIISPIPKTSVVRTHRRHSSKALGLDAVSRRWSRRRGSGTLVGFAIIFSSCW